MDPYAGRKYLRDYTDAFIEYERLVSDGEFQSELRAADIVLVGDYHALPRSQQFAAEVVEFLADSGKQVVLGLEAFFTSDQPTLDAWQAKQQSFRPRALAEIALRTSLRYDEEWGYPWEPVYELLLRASNAGARIAALDHYPRRDLRSIGRRDRQAAATIAKLRAEHPKAVIVVLFGESHLAPGHLPAHLRRALATAPGAAAPNMLTLLQNVDALYWQAASRERVRYCRCDSGELVPAVRVAEDVLCVFNASPLEKYESYRMCLERWREE